MKRTALALTFILALLISAVAGIASFKATSANAESAVPLTISILSPANDSTFFSGWVGQTYVATNVTFPLIYWTNEALSWVGYSINGDGNVTVYQNDTTVQQPYLLPNPGGLIYSYQNSLTLYANGTFGNWATPQTVTYVVPLPTSPYSSTPVPTVPKVPTIIFVTNVNATSNSGAEVSLVFNGNITNDQISNVAIATNQSAKTTTVSFTVTRESGTTGFGNITIPKSAVSYGTVPIIYIDGQIDQNQGYTQDSNNYYVCYTTSFSTNTTSIVFGTNSLMPEFPTWIILPLFAVIMLLSTVIIRKRIPKH
jgi:hypothetical protein